MTDRAAPPNSTATRERLVLLAVAIVALVGSIHFAHARFQLTVELDGQASLEQLMRFEADCPFQYRVLMPLVLGLFPVELFGEAKWRLMSFEFLATLGTILVFGRWLRGLLDSRVLAAMTSLLILPCLHYTYVLPRDTPLWFPSDIPSVFFFTAGLFLLQQRNWLAFYPVFALATLNRETACFLTVVYAFANYDRVRTREFWLHLVAQTTIWVAIKLGLYYTFRDNGGRVFYHHIQHNLDVLSRPTLWPALLSTLGFTGILAALGYPLLRDTFVRRALLVGIPFVGGMFTVGRILETRIFGELIPLTLAASILITAGALRAERSEG